MRDDQVIETESTELLRTLIRNACVNDGTAESGQEAKSVDALEDFFAGSGLDLERHQSNVIPDRIEVDVDVRTLPGVTPDEVDTMLAEALGDLAPRVEIQRLRSQMGSISSIETPLGDALRRVATALVPGSRVVPMITSGGTDAKYFRWKGIPSYGFGLHSPRIPYTEYPLMFHGHNERVDVDSLRLSAQMWETLCREFLA